MVDISAAQTVGGGSERPWALSQGASLGGYRVVKPLGRGGMGEVYLVEHVEMGKRYAMKLLAPERSADPTFRQRFRVEARLMADLDHPGIVRVHNMGEDGGRFFLVMDYVAPKLGTAGEGPVTLGDLMKRRKLTEREVRSLALGVARALQYAHSFGEGVVHRDLKPGNVLLGADGRVRVSDFGLAKVMGEEYLRGVLDRSARLSVSEARTAVGGRKRGGDTLRAGTGDDGPTSPPPGDGDPTVDPRKVSPPVGLTQSDGAVLGTFDYMSPEQKEGRADARSDTYALGLMIYRMLTGKRAEGRFPDPSRLGFAASWDRVIERTLAPDPAERYATAAELIADLEAVDTETAPAPEPGAPGRPAGAGKLALVVAGVLAALALAAGLYLWLVIGRPVGPPPPAGAVRVRSVRVKVAPPGYSRLPQTELPEGATDVRALAGSQVEVTVSAHGLPSRAWLELALPGEVIAVALEVSGGRASTWRGGFRLERSGECHVRWRDSDGRSAAWEKTLRLTAIPDAAPVALLSRYPGSAPVPPGASLNFELRANDDYGLAEVGLVCSVRGSGAAVEKRIPVRRLDGRQRSAIADHVQGLGTLGVKGGETVTFHAYAVDGAGNEGRSAARRVAVALPAVDEATAWRDAKREAEELAARGKFDEALAVVKRYLDSARTTKFKPLAVGLWGEIEQKKRDAEGRGGGKSGQVGDRDGQTGPQPAAKPGVAPARGGALLDFAGGTLTALRIAEVGKPYVKIARTPGGSWAFTAPAAGPADGARVGGLLRRLAELRSGASVEEIPGDAPDRSQRLAKYGLAPAQAALSLTVEGGAAPGGREVRFGSRIRKLSGATASWVVYARLAGSPEVVVVPADVLDAMRALSAPRPPAPARPGAAGQGRGASLIDSLRDKLAGGAAKQAADAGAEAPASPAPAAPGGKVAAAPEVRYAWEKKGRLEIKRRGEVRAVAFGPSGRFVAAGGDDNTAVVLGASSGRALTTLRGHASDVLAVAFSPDGRLLATGGNDGVAALWEVTTGRKLWTAKGRGKIAAAAFSPDGRLLASGGSTAVASLRDARDGKHLGELAGHLGAINALAFSPDGRYLATGSDDRTAAVWSVSTRRRLWTLTGHRRRVNAVAFSPEGRYVATGSNDETAAIWDAGTGARLKRIGDHKDEVNSVAFSPDGRFLATGSNDDTAALWGVSDGARLTTFEGHRSDVNSVAFSPDGRVLATGSNDGTVRLWLLPEELRSDRSGTR